MIIITIIFFRTLLKKIFSIQIIISDSLNESTFEFAVQKSNK